MVVAAASIGWGVLAPLMFLWWLWMLHLGWTFNSAPRVARGTYVARGTH